MGKSPVKLTNKHDENTHRADNIFLVNHWLQTMDLGIQLRLITIQVD